MAIDHFDPTKDLQFDLYFKKLPPCHSRGGGNPAINYEVTAGSQFGKDIIKKHSTLFKKSKSSSKKSYRPKVGSVYHPEISDIVAKSKADPIWDKLAEICFGCGICTYVCPICYCFESEDIVKIEGVSKCAGCRQRRWDSCMTADFAAISSHNFRPELRDRIYNWYHHKFVRTPKEHGFPGCVNCERCVVYCPARINFQETLKELIKKYS